MPGRCLSLVDHLRGVSTGYTLAECAHVVGCDDCLNVMRRWRHLEWLHRHGRGRVRVQKCRKPARVL